MFDNTKKLIDAAVYPNSEGNVTAYDLNAVLHNICDVTDSGKQDTLVSGENIKTVNGKSIIGSGNIDFPVDKNMSSSSTNPVQNLVVKEYIDAIEDKNKGYYSSVEILTTLHTKPTAGSRAYVGTNYPYSIYTYDTTFKRWVDTGEVGGDENVPLGEYYTKNTTDAYFVSKEDIKNYPTTDEVEDIINGGFSVISLEEYENLSTKENKLYFCFE